MRWQEHWNDLTFEELVAMYINDCMQYLQAKLKFQEPNLIKDEFQRTKDQDLIYYGLKDLKDMCMQIQGTEPMNWKDTPKEMG